MVGTSKSELELGITRRELLKLGVAACSVAMVGCGGGSSHDVVPFEMELGEAKDLKEGLNVFSVNQIGIVKHNDKLWGVKLVCTHQRCSLTPIQEAPEELLCPCHGSRFNIDGSVLQGPAEKPLVLYPVAINERGRVVVKRERRLAM